MKHSWVYVLVLVAVAAGALALRLPQLDRRVMHHDEANQAVKCGILQETGVYRYDPHEHHGPTLYYLSLPFAWLSSGRNFSGTSEITFRIVPVLFGLGAILLLYLVSDGLGWPAVICSAMLTAISPAMVYYSRFYIQETLLVFFTFGTIAAGWRYVRTRRIKWILLAGMFVGLMHATKETCVIAYGAMLLAVLGSRSSNAQHRSGELQIWHLIGGGVVAIAISVLFYSSFFTHWQGVIDSVRTYLTYLGRADGDRAAHVHPWYYYLQMLTYAKYGAGPVWSEGLIIVLALAGLIAVLCRKGVAEAGIGLLRFIALYAVLMTAAYSIIPYKTPWCMLSFLHGMVLLAGIGAMAVFRIVRNIPARVVIFLLLVGSLLNLGLQAYRANFKYYADPRNPYVYSHTSTDFLNLVKRVQDIARIHPDGRDMFIAVITSAEDAWPLPWYLRGFKTVGYWNQVQDVPATPDAPVIITSPGKEEALRPRLGNKYQAEFYGLRPQVLLTVYIRNDLWETFLKTR